MLKTLSVFLISYLLGSIPTAYIFGRLLKGIDIRKHGSGNVGATNALRILGKGPGIAVLLLDVAKGFLAVSMAPDPELMRFLSGICCILGHSYTVFLNFRGGKGVATSLGVLIGCAVGAPALRVVLAFVLGVFAVSLVLTKIVSVSSILAAASFPVMCIVFAQPRGIVVSAAVLAVFVIVRHTANIRRLMRGEEKKVKTKTRRG